MNHKTIASLLLLLSILLIACQGPEERSPEYEVNIFFQSDTQKEKDSLPLEDVFAAKTRWEENARLSQTEQNHVSRGKASSKPSSVESKTANRKPVLRIPEAEYDFGFVDEGELVAHRFRLFNEGPGTLKIEEILPSCGCTDVKASTMEVVSGAYVDISFNLETVGRPGSQQKLIEVFSNAGYHALKIKGVVYPNKFSQQTDSLSRRVDSL